MNAAQVHALLDLHDQAVQHYSQHPWYQWLPRDPVDALLVCVGAGPWRYGRRRAVQQAALLKYQGLRAKGWNFNELQGTPLFPLAWQNLIVDRLSRWCCDMDFSWPYFLAVTQDPADDLQAIAKGQAGGRFKVIDMFVRDFLVAPAFPIDRHVRAQLQEHGLPADQAVLLCACLDLKIDPIPLARWLGSSRLDGGNPDWSCWPDRAAPVTPDRTGP